MTELCRVAIGFGKLGMSRTRSWQEVAEVAAAEWTVREGAGTPPNTDDADYGKYPVLDLGNVTTGRHSAHLHCTSSGVC